MRQAHRVPGVLVLEIVPFCRVRPLSVSVCAASNYSSCPESFYFHHLKSLNFPFYIYIIHFKLFTIGIVGTSDKTSWMSPAKLRYRDVSSVSQRIFVSFDPSKENACLSKFI